MNRVLNGQLLSYDMILFVCSDDLEEDPGLLILFANDWTIHDCLRLVADYDHTINHPPLQGIK